MIAAMRLSSVSGKRFDRVVRHRIWHFLYALPARGRLLPIATFRWFHLESMALPGRDNCIGDALTWPDRQSHFCTEHEWPEIQTAFTIIGGHPRTVHFH